MRVLVNSKTLTCFNNAIFIDMLLKESYEKELRETTDVKSGMELFWFDADGNSESAEEYGLDSSDVIDAAYAIAAQENINILRRMELAAVLYDTAADSVAGALWTSIDPESFSFDIVIDREYQGKRLSHILIDAAMGEYNTQNEIYEETNDGEQLPIRIDAINPKMARILQQKYGFRIVQSIGDDRAILTK